MPRKKRYRVVGTTTILDHPPGSEFEASLPKDQEDFYIQIGGLEVVEEKPAKTKAELSD